MHASVVVLSADMDDTLVLTGDADLQAYTDVVALAKRLHEQVRLAVLSEKPSPAPCLAKRTWQTDEPGLKQHTHALSSHDNRGALTLSPHNSS